MYKVGWELFPDTAKLSVELNIDKDPWQNIPEGYKIFFFSTWQRKTVSAATVYSAPQKKRRHFCKLCLCCAEESWQMRDIEWNPGDTLCLTAFSLPTQGSNFTLLRGSCTHFSNRGKTQLGWMVAFDFPCVHLMIGPVLRSFMDYRALEFSENSFTRWNELSLCKTQTERTSGMIV